MRSPKGSNEKGSSILGLCGIIIGCGGLFFLFMDPTVEGTNLINMHKLVIGQTLTIVGTILVAVQWRPR